jgi:hypothetical protein
MNNDIWIVSQGPLNCPYSSRVMDYYNGVKNFIFSSWLEDTSDDNAYKLFYDKHHFVLQSRDGIIPGRAHLNLQCKSTLNGIEYAKERGAKYIFKTRSDLLIPNIEELAQRVVDKCVETGKFSAMLFDNKECTRQIGDLFAIGTLEDSELFWNISEQETIEGFAERILVHNFMKKKGITDYEMSNESLSKYFYWTMTEIDNMKLNIEWLKYPDRSPLLRHLARDRGFDY